MHSYWIKALISIKKFKLLNSSVYKIVWVICYSDRISCLWQRPRGSSLASMPGEAEPKWMLFSWSLPRPSNSPEICWRTKASLVSIRDWGPLYTVVQQSQSNCRTHLSIMCFLSILYLTLVCSPSLSPSGMCPFPSSTSHCLLTWIAWAGGTLTVQLRFTSPSSLAVLQAAPQLLRSTLWTVRWPVMYDWVHLMWCTQCKSLGQLFFLDIFF